MKIIYVLVFIVLLGISQVKAQTSLDLFELEKVSPDTQYVLPGEHWYCQHTLKTIDTSLKMIMVSCNSDLSELWGNNYWLYMEWAKHFRKDDTMSTWMGEIDSVAKKFNFRWAPNYSVAFTNNLWLYGVSVVMNVPPEQVILYELYGWASTQTLLFDGFYNIKTLVGIDGLRGDVNRDGVVNHEDVDQLWYYYDHWWLFDNYQYKYNKTGFNPGLSRVLFSSPDIVSTALINIWVHNPMDPYVANMGIGQLYSQSIGPTLEAVNCQINGQILNITTVGNVVNVTGLIKGGLWQKTLFVTNSVNIILPDGLTNLKVEAVKLPCNVTALQEKLISKDFKLEQNYPNPFNPTTTISYSVPKSSLVTLKVYDLLGKEVVTLVNEERTAGSYEAVFDASKLSGGTYFYRLTIGDKTITKKMILLK